MAHVVKLQGNAFSSSCPSCQRGLIVVHHENRAQSCKTKRRPTLASQRPNLIRPPRMPIRPPRTPIKRRRTAIKQPPNLTMRAPPGTSGHLTVIKRQPTAPTPRLRTQRRPRKATTTNHAMSAPPGPASGTPTSASATSPSSIEQPRPADEIERRTTATGDRPNVKRDDLDHPRCPTAGRPFRPRPWRPAADRAPPGG